jgi:2-C-methyl-D-erythritol 4-phosphate cytidylyltransferase / 2-C-methyl-D-erythritol 2,4-cyclodiphosphate synthase
LNGSPATPPRADAIVVAAGSSERMGGLDKLAWPIAGRPLLAHTLAALAAVDDVATIVVVTTPERQPDLASVDWLPAKVHAVVSGGARRQDSVAAGFAALEAIAPDPDGSRVVLVHDGARPVVGPALVAAVTEAADRYGAAIPVAPVVETIKRLDGDRIVGTVDRATLGSAQTPQGVRRSLWRQATADPIAAEGTWTDEAALLEACNITVHAVPGDPSNIKVTMPADLARVAAHLSPTAPPTRSGIGQDTHPFGPGTPLMLGGIAIERAPRLAGHSDGDVALHAIADALLGAAALGDLGRHYPAGPATPAGIASGELLSGVIERLSDAGWRPASVDLTIVGARPRLATHLEAMRAAIAGMLALPVERVSVKASTGNLDGSEGAGRAISVLALATILPLEPVG